MSIEQSRPKYGINLYDSEQLLPSVTEFVLYIAIAILAALFSKIIIPIFLDTILRTIPIDPYFYFETIIPFLAGITSFWLIVARALTRSKMGGTITGMFYGGIMFVVNFLIPDLFKFSPIVQVDYLNTSIISYVIILFSGLVIDFWFSMKIPKTIVFALAGSLAMVARGIVLFTSGMLFADYFSILGSFLIGPVSGVIFSMIGYVICSIIVNTRLLPFNTSNVMGEVDRFPRKSPIARPVIGEVQQQVPRRRTPQREAVRSRTPTSVQKTPVSQPRFTTPKQETVTPVKTAAPGIDKLKLFRNAISRSKEIPFNIATDVLDFNTEKELISWLWDIDLPGFEIDYSTKMIGISGAGEEVTDAIDMLLEKYQKMEDGGEGKI